MMYNDKKRRMIKGISFAVSVLIHVGLFSLILLLFPPVKVYFYQEVAEVRITPRESIGLLPARDMFVDFDGPSPKVPISEAGDAISGAARQGFVYSPNLNFSHDLEIKQGKESTKDFTNRFRLNMHSPGREGFSLIVSEKKAEVFDAARYLPPGFSSIRFSRIKTHTEGSASPSSAKKSRTSFYNQTFNVSSWAQEVSDMVRENWMPPWIDETRARGKAKIWVRVNKNGEILSQEVLESSGMVSFDQGAVQAILASLPFPPLPENFSGEKMEFFMVFQFYE
jgi:TonB family protein